MNKPKASKNKAEDVETKPPKVKRINISPQAKDKIAAMNNNMQVYLSALADEKGIKGPYTFDMKAKQIVVPE